jgi:hypothetical protein
MDFVGTDDDCTERNRRNQIIQTLSQESRDIIGAGTSWPAKENPPLSIESRYAKSLHEDGI